MVVSDEMLNGWTAALALVTHIDNRIDGDYPDSGAPTAPEPQAAVLQGLQPYLDTLCQVHEIDVTSRFLNAQQAAWFAVTREALSTLGADASVRADFRRNLTSWIDASYQTKSATSFAAFTRARSAEGLSIAGLFLCMNRTAHRDQSEAFAEDVRALLVAGEFFDSAVDYRLDLSAGHVRLRAPLARLRLAIKATSIATMFLWRHPSLGAPLAKKARDYVRNRRGTHNHARKFS